jgi:hypothetical protein
VVAGRRFLSWLVSAAALVSACGGTSTGTGNEGPDCVALCEKGKAESCTGSAGLNCDDNCFSEDARAETSGCRGAYNGTLTCSAELEDICTVASGCRAELRDYLGCIEEFCADNSADFCP